jgi:hypothetical protein
MRTAKTFPRPSSAGLLVLTLLIAAAAPAEAGVTFILNNVDAPGVGFNDPTPVVPVGGNPGLTLGEQRLNALQFAADTWGSILKSDVTVVLQATFFPAGTSFGPLLCTPAAAILGAASPIQIFGNFPGAAFADTWYHAALANRLAGFDLTPGPPDPGFQAAPFNDDLVLLFNDGIDDQVCLGSLDWYYGLDNAHGTDLSLVHVMWHELAHGLGFSNFVTEATGASPMGLPDVFTVFSLDNTTGQHWNTMTDAERASSALNCDNVVWDGPNATARAPVFLGTGTPSLAIDAPASLAGLRRVGSAAFGPSLSQLGVSGDLVLVDDGVGVTSDGCQTPFANAAAVAGKIALIDRGVCGFLLKVQNAEAAGATAVVIADNVAGCPPPALGGAGPVGIPSGRITLADGNTIKAALVAGTVHGTLGLNGTRLAGADALDHVQLLAANPLQPVNSIVHWDNLVFPNLLMEAALEPDLDFGVDLAAYQLQDVGWGFMTVEIDGCDSAVPNLVLPGGGTILTLVDGCAASAGNHGQFVSCVAHAMNALEKAGLVSGAQKGAIQHCAAHADIP